MRRPLALLSSVLLALAMGCSGSDEDVPDTTESDTTTTTELATLVECAELEGDVDAADATGGCVLEDGVVGVSVTYECDDGRKAFQVGDRIGVEGGEWQERDDDVDALDLC